MSTIKIAWGMALLLALTAGLASRRMMMGQGMMGRGMMQNSPRHRYVMTSGTPAPYDALRNPLAQDRQTIERGATVYQQNCAACHGPTGAGDGVAGRNLSPPPADLTQLAGMPMGGSDTFLYWTIAEGGAPVGSAMPAYKDALAKNDIWSVIIYLRAELLP